MNGSIPNLSQIGSKWFDNFQIEQILRENNVPINLLANLAILSTIEEHWSINMKYQERLNICRDDLTVFCVSSEESNTKG